jgi:hypothetical protein
MSRQLQATCQLVTKLNLHTVFSIDHNGGVLVGPLLDFLFAWYVRKVGSGSRGIVVTVASQTPRRFLLAPGDSRQPVSDGSTL